MASLNVTLVYKMGEGYIFRCGCGWCNEPKLTLEAAGLEIDKHLAEKQQRFPCPTAIHSLPREYDPTPLEPGEGRVIPRIE